MDVKQKAYEKYQMLWMLNHGYTLEDVWKMNRDREKNPDTNWMDLKEYVASEMQWSSKEEFWNNEYQNIVLMHNLLGDDEFEEWRRDVGNYQQPPIGVIKTPIGRIAAFVSPDSEYPGFLVEFHPDGENTGPGAILEYDPIKAKTQLRVYGKDDPEGDPVAVYSMS